MGFTGFLQTLRQNGRGILASSFAGTIVLTAGYFFLPVSSTDWLVLLIFLAVPVAAGIVAAMFAKSFRLLLLSLFLTAICSFGILYSLKWSGLFSLSIGVIFWTISLFIGGRLGNFCRRSLIEKSPHPRVVQNCAIIAMVAPLAILYGYSYEGMNRAISNVNSATKALETENDSAAKRSIDDLLSKSGEWPILPSDALLGDLVYGLNRESLTFWDSYPKLITACRQHKQYDLAIALVKHQLMKVHSVGNTRDTNLELELPLINFEAGRYSEVTDKAYAHLLFEAQRDFRGDELQSAAETLSKLLFVKDDANCRYTLANVLLCLGHVAEAKAQYRQALLLKPYAELACCCNKALAEADSLALILHEGYVGISLANNLVCEVSPGSSAEKAGVKGGDKILSVDYRPIIRQNSEEICQMIKGPIGTQVRVGLEREGKKHDVLLTRARSANGEKLAQLQVKNKLPKPGECRDDAN